MKKKFQKGQTLIEALIALGAAVIVIAAITAGAISSLSTTEFNSNENLATHYAQEGIEFANHLAEVNWTNFKTYQGDYCYDSDAVSLVLKGLNNCALSSAPIFSRVISISQGGGGQCVSSAYVLVTVSWKADHGNG